MLVPADPDHSGIPDKLKSALGSLARKPSVNIASGDLIREMLARDLIEWKAGFGIRFTAEGRRIFNEVRQTNEQSRESDSGVLPPGEPMA